MLLAFGRTQYLLILKNVFESDYMPNVLTSLADPQCCQSRKDTKEVIGHDYIIQIHIRFDSV